MSSPSPSPSRSRSRSRSRLSALGAAAVLVLAALTTGITWWPRSSTQETVAPAGAPLALMTPRRLARQGVDGPILIADPEAQRVFRWTGTTLQVLAGTGAACKSHCCTPATEASTTALSYPSDVLLAETSGAILIANTRAGCVLRVPPAGGIEVFAMVDGPEALTEWPGRGVLIAEAAGCRVRLVDKAGRISTVAGTGECGFSGDTGPAIAARLNAPGGLAVTPDGTGFVIADTDNGRLREVRADGTIVTLAGTGRRGTSQTGATAMSADLNEPEGLLYVDGTLWIADTDNSLIRRLSGGQLTEFTLRDAQNADLPLRYPKGLLRDGQNLLIADTDNGRIVRVRLDGTQATVVLGPEHPDPEARGVSNETGALPTAERERRLEVLRNTSPGLRPDKFRELTDDIDLDEADRAARFETFEGDPLVAFEELLKRARTRSGGN